MEWRWREKGVTGASQATTEGERVSTSVLLILVSKWIYSIIMHIRILGCEYTPLHFGRSLIQMPGEVMGVGWLKVLV
jgi:hypothetical protein